MGLVLDSSAIIGLSLGGVFEKFVRYLRYTFLALFSMSSLKLDIVEWEAMSLESS